MPEGKKPTKVQEDVKLPEVEVLETNDAKGLPEAGASIGVKNCCTVVWN